MKVKNKWMVPGLCLGAVILLVILDQWSKAVVASSIPYAEEIPVIPGFFDLTYLQNTGAAFSSFDGIGMWFFIILTFAAVAGMVWYFFKTKNLWMKISLTLITAGAIGNLIDRMCLGYVRDFLLFYISGSPFPVFNIADVCITCGFILLIGTILFEDFGKGRHANG